MRARDRPRSGGCVWAVAVDAPDEHQATDKARGQPGPDQAKVSPEHRAKTFLDGAVAEGPIAPYPLRPESPPKLMEMIQFLTRRTAGTFSLTGRRGAIASLFELATSLIIRQPNSWASAESPKGATSSSS